MVGAGPAGGLNDVVEQLENRSLLTYNTVTSMVAGSVVTFAGDANGDVLTLTNDGLGNLQHNRFAAGDGGYASAIDLDPNQVGVQSLAINAITGLIIQAGDGNDTIQLGALNLTALNNAMGLQIDGGTGTADAIDIQGVVTIGNAGAGRLVITTAETLTQQAGATLTVQGTTSISGLTSSLVLNQANNFVGSVTINSSSDVTVNDTNAIDFAGISAANLTLSAGGAITDSGAGTIVATGATSLTAGAANNITLDNANNNFGGTVSIVSGNNVTLTDILGLDLGNSNIAGTLTVNLSGGGSVTDSGNLTVGGNTQINAAGLNVTLNSAGNNFAGIGINGHTVAIVDSNGVDLRASNITDTFSVTTTAGDITNSGALVVTNAATFTANGTNANITVNNAGNTFNGAVSFVGPQLGSVNVLDTTALVLPTLNLTGNLTVTAQGITQGANTLTVAGTTSLTTTGVTDVNLPNANNFTGAVTINSSQAATINDINAITFGNVTTATNAGSFNVTANGAISDGGAGVITVGGTTTLAAGAGNNITLNQATNDFGTTLPQGAVTIVSGNNVTLRDMNTIDLGASTVSGTLSVTSNGLISDSGALNVTGTTTLAAGAANNITLDAGNNFSTVSITSGLNVLLNDVNAIDLGASNVSGTLTITASGNITDSGAVSVTGITTLTPGAANSITLDNGNDFSTVVLVNGTNVTLNDTNAIALETTNPLSGTLTVTAGGAITDSNPITVVGVASFSTPGQNITLNNNNDFNTVSAVGATIVLTDSDNIVLGTVTASGSLTVNANGPITDSGIVTVGLTTSLTAGVANDITLDTAANNFTGAVTVVSANDVTLVDQNAIVLGAITTSGGGNLSVSAGADITQTAGVVTVTGATTLSTGAGSDITLTTATNDFQGTVTVTSANDVQIDDANAITFGNVTTSGGGNFTVDAGGAIQFNSVVTVTGNADIESNANAPGSGTITDNGGMGQMVITGTTTFDAGGNNISFSNAMNNFGGAVSVTDGIAGNDANDVTLVDANAITLGNIFAGGNLTVTVLAGDITATGILDIDGNTLLNGVAGANIIAGNLANSFTLSVNVTPNVGLNNLTLVDSEATGLILQSGLNINGNLTVQGRGLTQAAGGITVGGQSTLVSTGGIAMNLTDPNNDFVGAVTVNTSGGGGGASIRDMNSIDFGGAPVLTSNVQGPFTVVANGAITDSGNMVVTGAASFTAGAANNITLDATTNDFQNGVSIVSGNNVTLTDANSIALGTSAIAGTLTVTALNGAITDNGNVVVNGAGTTLTANGAANDITFNDAGTDLGGTVTVTNGRNVLLSDSVGGITLGAITATGLLQVTAAAGDINNTGAIVVNGNSTFTANAAGANITVNNAGNTFVGSVTFAGAGGLNNVTVSDTTPLDLAGLTINGNLTVTSTALGVTSITDSGNLNVGGTTTLTADPTSNIVLDNNNSFGGAVSVVSANNVTLNETSTVTLPGIVLGASTVSGTYTVTSVKSITQTGALNITGLPTFTVTDSPTAAASSQDILLDTQANNFVTTPVFTNNGIIRDLKLRNTNAAAAIPVIATVANSIQDLSIVFNNTAIVLPALVFTRDLNVQAGGDITQSAALTVPRNATFTVPNANNITLTNPGNNFAAPGVGQVNVVSGNNVSLTDANTIGVGDIVAVGNVTINSTGTVDFVGIGASNIGGTLNVNNGAAGGADILQTGGGGLTVAGTTTLAAGNGVGNDITLNTALNDFSTVVITSAEDVLLFDFNGIDFGTSTVSATLNVTFAFNVLGANVTQSGALTVTGATNFASFENAAPGSQISEVLLHTQANNFGVTPVFTELFGNGTGIRDLKLRNTNAGAAVPVVNPAGSLAGGFLRDVTLIYDNAAIDVPASNINITGNLTLTAGGAITDTGFSLVGGTTTLTTTNVGGSPITLDNAGNNFIGAVSAINNGAANSNVLLTDANAIVLGTINTSGNLTVNAVGITQSNATALDGATVGGTSTFNGGAGVITLNDPQNDFTGAVSLNNNGANNVSVTDANAIVLGASAVGTGTLTVNAVGITQAAAPNAIVQTAGAGAATFNGGAGVITLNDPNNDFTGNVSLNNTGANNVQITDVNAIQFGTSNVGTGTLTVNSSGAITQAAVTSIIQAASAGAATFNAGANAITLNNATNDFTGAVSLNNNGNNNISLQDANTLILGASNFGTGNFNITAGGHITQTGALIEAAAPVGVATFTVTAANSDILLASAANNFTATPNFATAGAGTIRDLALRNVNVGNALASAALIPSPALLGAGTLRDLTLSFDNDPIDVPVTNFSVTRNLSLTAAGTITDTGTITAPGTTTLNSGANAITLNSAGNNFGTVIANNNGANNVTLVDTNSIDLGASNIGGALLVTSGAGGGAGSHITESGILLIGTGGSTFTLNGANSDVLLGAFANNIAYPITVATTGAGTLRNFTLQNVNAGPAVINFPAVANNLTLNIVGAVSLGALNLTGNLNLTSTGDITQTGAWVVAGTSTFAPGAGNNVTLNNAGNNFNTVSISDGNALTNPDANNVSITDLNGIDLGASSIGGTLNIAANGNITDSGNLVVAGNATFAPGAGNSTILDSAGNDFSTAIITNGLNATLTDLNAINLGGVNITGNLTVNAGGAVTDSGNIAAATGNINAAGQNVTLDQAANDFTGALSVNGANVTLVDANALDLGASNIGGTLNITTAGALTDSGNVVVGGITTITAGAANDVTLDSAGNDFQAAVNVLTADDIVLNDVNGIVLNQITPITAGGSLAVTAGGNITDTVGASMNVNGNASFNAGANNITLGNDAGDVQNFGSLDATGNVVSISEDSNVDVNLITATALTLTSEGGAILDNNAGNNFAGPNGATVALTAMNGIGSGNALEGQIANLGLAFRNTNAGNVQFTNTGAMSVVALGALATSNNLAAGGTVVLTAASPVTFVVNTFSAGNINATANESAAVNTDNITVNPGVTVQSGTGDITFQAGDRIIIGNGANVLATGIGGDVSFQSATADADGDGSMTLDGTISAHPTGGVVTLDALNQQGVTQIATGTITGNALQLLSTGVSGSFTLNSATNDVNTIAANTAGSISVRDTDDLTVGTVASVGIITTNDNVSLQTGGALLIDDDVSIGNGNLTLNSVGNVTQNAGDDITASGLELLGAGAGVVTLTNTGNDVTTLAALTLADITIDDATGIIVGTVNATVGVATLGNLVIDAGGNVQLNAAVNVNNLDIQANANNAAGGAISGAAALAIVGTTILETGNSGNATNDISLTNVNNLFFGDMTIVSTNDATLVSLGSLNFAGAAITNNLDVTVAGNLTDSGTVTVVGTSTFTAGANNVILDNALNNFTGAVSVVSATNATFTDANAINFGNVAITGNFVVNAAGAVTDSGVLAIGGTTTVNNAGNVVTFDSAANDFSGAVSASGSNITLVDVNAINLGTVTATGNLQVTSGGTMTDSGTITVVGTTLLNSGAAANITLDTVTNDFQGVVTITNSLVASIDDANGIGFGNVTTVGNFTVDAGGNVGLGGNINVGGNLAVDANANLPGVGGSITDNAGVGILNITGTTTLNTGNPANGANDISLVNSANNFVGAVTITSANDAEIDDANTITFGAVTTNAGFSVDAGGLVTLSGATNVGTNLDIDTDVNNAAGGGITATAAVVVAGNARFDAAPNGTATNDVTLNAANDFQGPVTIIANDASVNDINALSLGAQTINENLTVTAGGNVTFNGAANIGQNLSVNTTTNNAAGGTITDNANVVVGGTTALTAGAANDITLNNANNFVGSVNVVSGNIVTLNDINAIDFSGANVSGNLVVTAAGNITDTGNIAVTGNASFLNTAGLILLGDGAVNTNFGSLTLNSATSATVTEDSATDIAGNNVIATSLSLTSAGAVTDGVGTGTVVVVGTSAISGTSINLTDNAADNFGVNTVATFTASGGGNITINALGLANFGSVTFNTTGNVTINEDSSTDFFNVSTANNLVIVSTGGITDQSGSSVTATGTASLTGTSITLLDNADETLNVTGNANFAGGAGNITINAAGTSNFGSINFNTTGNVTINEDSAMDISNAIPNTAAILTLNSSGAITDQAGVSVTTTGAANITGASLNLADNAADIWNIAGNANLTATSGGNITVNAAGTVNFGSLTVNTTGNVTVTEDSATDFAGNSTAAILTVTSAGAITDNVGGAASIITTGNANLTGASISLADNAGDVLTVGGNANLIANLGGAITVAAAGAVNFNTLTFNTTGPVTITEDSQTDLTGVSTAGTLALTSAGAITDAATASTTVTNNASFTGTTITLGDQAGDTFNVGSLTFNSAGAVSISENSATDLEGVSTANSLVLISTGAITDQATANTTVTNNASFNGTSITLGDQAGDTFNAGSITANSAGVVSISENSASDLAGANTASNFSLTSTGAITDAVTSATLTTTGTASFNGTSISLTDNGSDALAIAGAASFTATAGAITIAAAGAANFASVTFNATGAVTINEDSATDIAGANTGDSLVLNSTGAITDQANATIAITNNANFSGTSITIGDQGTDTFVAGTLTFNSAGTVAITEDSAMDLSGANTAATLNLTSSGALTDQAGTNLTVTGATTLAAQSVVLNTTINLNTLTANSVNGAITIFETNGLTLTNINSFNGDITIESGGSVNAILVSANGAGRDLSIDALTGDLIVGVVTAADDVSLFADLGGIVDDVNDGVVDITGDALLLFAGNGIGTSASGSIDTNVTSLRVIFNGVGSVVVNEANSITLTDVSTVNGSITIVAAGSIIATDVQTGTDLDVNDISLTTTAGGALTAGLISSGNFGDVTLNIAGGISDDNDGTTDITADVLAITAGGAIGASGQDLDINVNTLTTNTATAAGNQFLNEANTLTVGAADLTAGAASITLGGGTFLTDANGSILSILNVLAGATLGGTGTTTTVNVIGGNVAPGASPGTLNTGSVTFDGASTFTVEVNGVTAGSEHDQLNVTGTVTLGGATLNTSGAIISDPGQAIVLIRNDSTEAVNGTFNGLAEGATVTIAGVNFIITYAGSAPGSPDANDVILFQAGASLGFTDNDGAADTWTIRRVGGNTQTLNGSAIIHAQPTVTISDITINGEANQNDTLIVEFTGGDPLFGGPNNVALTFNGGAAGTDRLRVRGDGAATTANYTPDAAINNAGTVAFNSGSVLTFTGLEPLDLHAMASVTLTGSAGVDQLTVAQGTDFTLGGVINALRVSGTASGATIETLALWNTPTFTLNALGGNDVITNTTLTTTLGINTIIINGGDDADTFNFDGVLTAPTNVDVNGDAGNDTFVFANAGQVVSLLPIDGGADSDTIVGDNDGNTFTVTGANSGNLTGKVTALPSFINVENLTGGTGTDTFTLSGGTVTGVINGAGGTDTLNLDNVVNAVTLATANGGTATGTGGFSNIENINGNGNVDTFTITGGSITGSITGGGGVLDVLNLANVANTVNINTANGGTATGIGGTFAGIENINGNVQTDAFSITNGGSLTGVLNGGGVADSDTLTLDNVLNTVSITGANDGTATGIGGGFLDIENVTGNANVDQFSINGGTLTGNINGTGGTDTLTLDNVANSITVNALNGGSATGIGGFSNVENIVGNGDVDQLTLTTGTLSGSFNGRGGNDLLALANGTNSAVINDVNGGTATGLGAGFSNVENLNGGSGTDTIRFTNTGSLDGNVVGGLGDPNDTLIGDDDGNVFVINAVNGGTLAAKIGGTFADIENLTGGEIADSFTFTTTGFLDGEIDGANGDDTLIGDANGNVFTVTGADSGTLTEFDLPLTPKLTTFSNVENLTGGVVADQFNVQSGASLSGAVNSGAGDDTLDINGSGTVGSFNGGADTDTLDLAGVAVVTVDLQNASATGINSSFTNVEDFIGNDNDATLIGLDAVTTWTINGVNDGTLDVPVGTTFTDFNNLQGGSADDEFTVTPAIGDVTGSIRGGDGNDLFVINNPIQGSVDGQGDVDTLSGTEINDVTLTGSNFNGYSGNEADIGDGFDGIDSLVGTNGRLTGENVDATWTLNSAAPATAIYNDGNTNLEFSGFVTLQGGSAVDTFDIVSAVTHELRGGNGADVFNLSETLTGDIFAEGGLDQIVFFDNGQVDGNVDGGTSAALDYSNIAGPVTVTVDGPGTIDGYQGTADAITGIFDNITTVIGSQGDDTLNGGNADSEWNLGSVATYQGFGSNELLNFAGFELLQGGIFSDVFNINEDYSANLNGGDEFIATDGDVFNLNAVLTGLIDGELGHDTLQGSRVDEVLLSDIGSIDGFQGDEPDLTHFDNINALFGNGGTLTGLSVESTWFLNHPVSGLPTYEADGSQLVIGGFDNLQGGTAEDHFLVIDDSEFNLLGGGGGDDFDIDAVLDGSLTGQGWLDTLTGDLIDDVTLFGSASDGYIGADLDITGGFSGIETLIGNGGRVVGMAVNSTWTLDGSPVYFNGTHHLAISGFDTLQGNSAVDTFIVSSTGSPFSLRGGAGNDLFTFPNGSITGTADGELGNDTLNGANASEGVTLLGGGGNDTIIGSRFADSLAGGDGNDSVTGGAGNDTLSGGSGTNILDGGAGTDCVTDLVTVNGVLTNTKLAAIGNTTLISIECADLLGDLHDNVIDASAFTLGPVTLNGGAGNDTLIGSPSNDSLDGGDGFDVVRFQSNTNIVATNTTVSNTTRTDVITSIEGLDLIGNATKGTSINAAAFSGKTTLTGGSGNDTLFTGQRDALVKAGAGNDTIRSGAGNDLVYGGAGNDTVDAGIGNDIVRGEDGNDSIFGNIGDDRLFGDAGRDKIDGGVGQDSLDGGADNDSLLGGAGHDTMTGGAGNDLMSGGAGHDTMFGEAGNDTLLGDEGHDSLSGGAGRDLVLGGDGDDKIDGGSDTDTLAGNAGNDTISGSSSEINEFFIFDIHKLLI